jgi:toxin-antitoxin system PIN domain toxin
VTYPAANLLDVNFLVALAWPNHIAHSRAVSWFLENRDTPFATCPMTEAGFVRISMNPLIVTEHISAGGAVAMLEKYRIGYKHVFWPDTLAIGEALSAFKHISGHRQITDSYLLALAIAYNGTLISFDGGIAEIAPQKLRNSLVLVEF